MNLIITASIAVFEARSTAPPSMNIFKDKDKRTVVALPSIDDDAVSWTIPDTPENRQLFRRNYEPSGLYSCEAIDVKAAEPFSVKAKGKTAPAATLSTLHVAPNANANIPPKNNASKGNNRKK